jgi:SagB-type dehydrogenase family enzyme
MEEIKQHREFMKSNFGKRSGWRSDQQRGVPNPPLQKAVEEDSAQVIDLPEADPELMETRDFFSLLEARQSRRNYSRDQLTLPELAFLLYSTQGVKEEIGEGYASRRPVPSAGARHPFETYLAVSRVEGLEPGLYRYLPFSHQLLHLEEVDNLPGKLTRANLGQGFVGAAACVFIWSCRPYRAEWRYGPHAHKNMLLDAGHLGQNLYLAVEALGAGTCAIGAYDQGLMDNLLRLDGEEEYVIYLAPVGVPREVG